MSGTLYEHLGTRLEAELAVIAMHDHSKLTFHQKTDHLIDRFTELAKKERQSRCGLVPADRLLRRGLAPCAAQLTARN